MPTSALSSDMPRAEERPAVRRVGPLHIRMESGDALIDAFLAAHAQAKTTHVAFANTHLLYCVLREPRLQASLNDFYLLNDGVGMSLLSRVAHGRGFAENLNGTDFVPRLLDAAPLGTRVFLLGGREDVTELAAAEVRRRFPGLIVCGFQDGYSVVLEGEALLARLRDARPDIILVALGNPRQEEWIRNCSERLGVGLFIAVGALFDFLAGAKPRAPLFLRKARLEWMFRLTLEPKRLLHRYTFEIAWVAWAVVKQRLLSPALR